MPLSNHESVGPDTFWGRNESHLGLVSPQLPHRPTVLETGVSIDLMTITHQEFAALKNGYMEEEILLSLLITGDLDQFANLREDCKPHIAPSGDLMTVSYLTGLIVRGKYPIATLSDALSRSEFAQIFALSYPISGEELLAKIQREKERATTIFPNAFFAPAEDIGSFSAPRRYFATLEMASNGVHYSRDYFRPLEPMPLDIEHASAEQKERYQRDLTAHDLYLRETWLIGDPMM